METLKKIEEEIELLKKENDNLDKLIEDHKKNIIGISEKQDKIQEKLFKKNLYLVQIKEIQRIAKNQFSRLHKRSEITLTEKDQKELDKWIGRVKSEDGLKDIIDALNELRKYYPNEIKLNVYALVQKVIIGGAFNSKRKPAKT